MKKNIFLILIIAGCYSCNGNGKIDESKIDEAGSKLQKTVEKGADTIGAKIKRFEKRIDTLHTDTSKY